MEMEKNYFHRTLGICKGERNELS